MGQIHSRARLFGISALCFLLIPTLAYADAGIPMLPVTYPVMLLGLLPVVLVETIFLLWKLKTNWWRTLWPIAIANLLTMLFGFPLVWFIYVCFEFAFFTVLDKTKLIDHIHLQNHMVERIFGVILSAGWLGPVEHGEPYWPIYLAFIVLLIPSYFFSAFLEARLISHEGWITSGSDLRRPIWQANLVSYCLLAIAGCLFLHYQIGR
jgi:hypothetical protein